MVAAIRRKPKIKQEYLRLDLGCGQNKRDGFTGVDIAAIDGVDVVHDLRVFPWPFKDLSVSEIYSCHFFEHLDGPERMKFMDEAYRILLPTGTVELIVPYYNSLRASQDPTHKWPPVSEGSFLYFNKEWREINKIDHYPIVCDFDFSYAYEVGPQWSGRNEEMRAYAITHYTNVVSNLKINLTKR